ncbi:MAG TPA: DUF1778 domain-containing protein [Mycobacteriales bacterium]|jgi:uncharacterized protein (DUF1778 family)|nr:DUF1778 domain-containing protein [Mycobacteriales bacterium]
MTTAPPRRSARINLRVDPALDALLRRAAALTGVSLSAFLLDAARERAQHVVSSAAPPLAEPRLPAHPGVTA